MRTPEETQVRIEKIEIQVSGMTFDGFAAGPKEAPVALLLHGFPQFADSWLKVLPGLGKAGLRAVALNQRGYAKGANPDRVEDYALPLLVDDVLCFADALGAEKFHLVGHDWGGVVGWQLAAQNPNRLDSLSIISTPHLDAFRSSLLKSFDQLIKSSYIALFRAPFHLAEKSLRANNWKSLRNAYLGHVDTEQVEENIRRFGEDHRLTSALNWYRAMRFSGKLGEIAVPTLYVWGSEDQALGEVAANETGRFLRAPYRFERLHGGSHWLPDEHPEVLAKWISEHALASSGHR
jgi:pimeloyl-ACP methyl ester carboxylesterase